MLFHDMLWITFTRVERKYYFPRVVPRTILNRRSGTVKIITNISNVENDTLDSHLSNRGKWPSLVAIVIYGEIEV